MEEFETSIHIKVIGTKPAGVSVDDFISQHIVTLQYMNKKSSTYWPYGTKNPNEPTVSVKEVSVVKPF
jgi:hypothetical protein